MTRRILVAAVLVVTTMLLTAAPASAEVVTRWDPEPKCSQRPALDVKRATFNYAEEKFVWRIKMGALSKEHTRVIARYNLGDAWDGYDVMLVTRFDKFGNQRTVGSWSDGSSNERHRFTRGVTAEWNWQRRVIKFELTSHVEGQRANAWAYSVAKGEFHGPPCGDYIWSGRINRG